MSIISQPSFKQIVSVYSLSREVPKRFLFLRIDGSNSQTIQQKRMESKSKLLRGWTSVQDAFVHMYPTLREHYDLAESLHQKDPESTEMEAHRKDLHPLVHGLKLGKEVNPRYLYMAYYNARACYVKSQAAVCQLKEEDWADVLQRLEILSTAVPPTIMFGMKRDARNPYDAFRSLYPGHRQDFLVAACLGTGRFNVRFMSRVSLSPERQVAQKTVALIQRIRNLAAERPEYLEDIWMEYLHAASQVLPILNARFEPSRFHVKRALIDDVEQAVRRLRVADDS
jgi:hypothetical protein